MLSEMHLNFDRWGPGQQRAITFLWAATQVAARVVREAFVHIYASLPDSKNGHTSLKDYCKSAGHVNVYLELLHDGYMSEVLSSSPKETTFLDIKVARLVLDRVLSERFGKDKYRKLMFEVRQLAYLRNDLCHQLLPALTLQQYLSQMKQLETRLCVVISEAALIAGPIHTPVKALQDIHALFASLLHKDETQTEKVHRLTSDCLSRLRYDKQETDTSTQTDPVPALFETTTHTPDGALQDNHSLSASLLHHHEKHRAENGTQTDLHSPDTLEKGIQARMDFQQRDISEGTCGDANRNTTITTNTTTDSQYPGIFGDASQNTEHITNSPKNSADPGGFNVFSRSRGVPSARWKTRGDKKIGQGEGQEKQRGKQKLHEQERHEKCCGACPFSSQSSIKSLHHHHDVKNWEDSRHPFCLHDTMPVARKGLQHTPGHSLCHDDMVTLRKLTFEAVTINHVFVKVQDDDRLPLEILISLVLKVVLFLVVLIVSLLPLAIALLRVMLSGVQCSWNNANLVYRYLWELFYGPTWQETLSVPEVVLVPRLDPLRKIEPHQLRGINIDYRRDNRKALCRRKGRRN